MIQTENTLTLLGLEKSGGERIFGGTATALNSAENVSTHLFLTSPTLDRLKSISVA